MATEAEKWSKSRSPSPIAPSVTCNPREQLTQFNPAAYLNGFYGSPDEVPAMHVAIICIPNLMHRIPKGGTLLDIGSGPTVHVAICFRHHVDAIYMSDYASTNRKVLLDWWRSSEGRWDWSHITSYLSMFEGIPHNLDKMETETRKKLGGIINCDVHNKDVVISEGSIIIHDNEEIKGIPPKMMKHQYDVLTTFYCLEYATTNMEEYLKSMSNICSLLKPGGHLMMGGVMGANSYTLDGKKFMSLNLTEEGLFDTLQKCNMTIVPGSYRNISEKLIDSVFALVARKAI